MDTVELNENGLVEVFNSRQMGLFLEELGYTITAVAIPFSGVDTGRLVGSMGFQVTKDNESGISELVVGSGVQDGVEPVFYALMNWGGVMDDSPAAKAAALAERGASHPKNPEPKETPTTPYSKSFQILGLGDQALNVDGVKI